MMLPKFIVIDQSVYNVRGIANISFAEKSATIRFVTTPPLVISEPHTLRKLRELFGSAQDVENVSSGYPLGWNAHAQGGVQ